ncbi:hypothetical protein THRCLA_23274, partial [Thraustotheca clavata]
KICHITILLIVIERKVNYQDDDEVLFQVQSIIALRCTKGNGRFFVAQLLDDVTQSMLDHSNANVNVLYYDKQRNGKFKLRNYGVAPIRSLMCVIELDQVNDNEFEIPRHYHYRVSVFVRVSLMIIVKDQSCIKMCSKWERYCKGFNSSYEFTKK